ncbi:MAG: hypothetical protein VW709_06465, partial [Rickettsiales bacterium]
MTSAKMGQSAPRLEDRRFLTGTAQYADDLNMEGQVYGAVVRSPHAHADITGIDVSAAAALPGVLGVHTVADLDADGVGNLPCVAELPEESGFYIPPRPALARDRVRYVGDHVAFVVAQTEAVARAAADLVEVGYEMRPAVTDGMRAQEAGAPLLWDAAAGNVIYRWHKGDKA